MPRARRFIESNCAYEICFRAREGLPLVANYLMRFILACVVARVQRDQKLIVCHDLWNASHAHIVVVVQDAYKAVQFYREVQKQITDIIKRLLGYRRLNIWEGRPTLIKLNDIGEASDRISYIYANPAQDNLELNIDRFPGYSSWRHFLNRKDHLNETISESYPWLRLPTIPRLKSAALTDQEYRSTARLLRIRNKKRHILAREPNAWMKCFGISTQEEVKATNARIINRIRQREETAARIRESEGKTVMGATALLAQPIMKPHTPKKHDRKIFIVSSFKEERIEYIKAFHRFCERCKECYERWKIGYLNVVWPLGAFKPPVPLLANLIPGID